MERGEYTACQETVSLIASVIEGLPLEAFLAAAKRSLEVGVVADPTLYRKVSPKLELIISTAEHLRAIQQLNHDARSQGTAR